MKAHILSFLLSRSGSVNTDGQGLASLSPLGLTWAKGLFLHLTLGISLWLSIVCFGAHFRYGLDF